MNDLLKQYFGYDEFRPGQKEIIQKVIDQENVLGIMPTGSGKSICYQLPSLLVDGLTVVVSPLISLMKDQVESLNQAGIHAAYLNSSLTVNQYYKALSLARNGRYPIMEGRQRERLMHYVERRICRSPWWRWTRPTVYPSGDRISGPVI